MSCDPQSTSENTSTTSLTVKTESDVNTNEEHNVVMEIKIEKDDGSQNEDLPKSEEPFENIRIEIKQEVNSLNNDVRTEKVDPPDRCDKEKLSSDVHLLNETQVKLEKDSVSFDDKGNSRVEPVVTNNDEVKVKEEIQMDLESVSYDYPDFNDADSMDSANAAALENVEACLDDVNVKTEDSNNFDNNEILNDEYSADIKMEQDLTVTETCINNIKNINTTSTVTDSQDGLVESHENNLLEMIPVNSESMATVENSEEILSTGIENSNNDDAFQLNSITGNVLSLEQEAYSLLKAKRQRELLESNIICPKCPKMFKYKSGLKAHLKVHDTIERRIQGVQRGMKTKKENMMKKRKLEDKAYNAGLKKIMADTGLKKIKVDAKPKDGDNPTKREGYNCTCGKVFQRRSRMETCLRSHSLSTETSCFSCITCTKSFKDKDQLTLHRKRLHSRKKFPCKFCPTDYNTRKELFKHLQIHQEVQLMEYKVISEFVKGKKKLRCFMCSKSYSELSDLKCHVMDDHKEPYICPHCKQTFSKIIDFGNHTKTSHPEVEGQSVLDVLEAFSKLVKAWKCEECELQFHEADKLAMHQLEKHSPELKMESQFQCTDCRRVFVSQKGLTSHRRVHHNTETIIETEPEEQGVMCLECRKMCKDMEALTSHMRLHSPDRKYPCKFCDFRFATPEKRKAHAEIHTGDMKFVCFICEYQCSSENRLRTHKDSIKHLNMKEYLLTGKPLIEEEQSTSKQEKIKDSLKKNEWGTKKRKSDKQDSSDSEQAVSCEICGDKFSSEDKMLEHKQTHPFIEFPNDDKPSRIFFK